jgi:hypothetical protein
VASAIQQTIEENSRSNDHDQRGPLKELIGKIQKQINTIKAREYHSNKFGLTAHQDSLYKYINVCFWYALTNDEPGYLHISIVGGSSPYPRVIPYCSEHPDWNTLPTSYPDSGKGWSGCFWRYAI